MSNIRAVPLRRIWVPDEDKDLPVEEQLRFHIRTLRQDIYAEVQDYLLEFRAEAGEGNEPRETRTQVKSGTQETKILMHGIESVEGFFDEDGNELKVPTYTKNNPAPMLDFLTRLPARLKTELARAIIGDSRMKKEEKENLGGGSRSRISGDGTAETLPAASAH